MAARLPLRAVLRDIVMMLCGSLLGILLARGFVSHDLKMADIAHLCGTVEVSKKVERSKIAVLREYLATKEGSGLLSEGVGSEGGRRRGRGGGGEKEVITGIYPHAGQAGSGSYSERSRRKLLSQTLPADEPESGSGSGRSKLYQDMMHYLDLTAIQDTVEQDTESSDAPDYQDTLTYLQDTDRTNQDTKNYQDKVHQQVISDVQDRSLSLFVGVVTQKAHLSRTVKVTMDTWGQSSRNLTFYSFGGLAKNINEEEEDVWAWHDPRRIFVKRKKQIESVVRLKGKKSWSSKLLPQGSLEAIQVVHHIQMNSMDQFDWFLLVPEDVYVQLDRLKSILQHWNSNTAVMLSRASHGSSGCGLGKGVVLSQRYLWELRGKMESLMDSGVCSKGRLLWRCIYRHMVERDGFNCILNKKVSDAFTDVFPSPSNSAHPTPDSTHTSPARKTNSNSATTTGSPSHSSSLSLHTMYTLHRKKLLEALDYQLEKTAAIRESLARTALSINQEALL